AHEATVPCPQVSMGGHGLQEETDEARVLVGIGDGAILVASYQVGGSRLVGGAHRDGDVVSLAVQLEQEQQDGAVRAEDRPMLDHHRFQAARLPGEPALPDEEAPESTPAGATEEVHDVAGARE